MRGEKLPDSLSVFKKKTSYILELADCLQIQFSELISWGRFLEKSDKKALLAQVSIQLPQPFFRKALITACPEDEQ